MLVEYVLVNVIRRMGQNTMLVRVKVRERSIGMIKLVELSKRFPNVEVLDRFSLELPGGDRSFMGLPVQAKLHCIC